MVATAFQTEVRVAEVEIGEHRLYIEDIGSSAARPLLLIGGLTQQVVHWPHGLVDELLQRGFRVIRYDNRDIGLSSCGDRGVRFDLRRDMLRSRLGLKVRANYNLYDLARDAVELIDEMGLARVHLFGMSMGGMIAQIVAATEPDRVASLTSIMSNTNEPWLPPPALPLMRQLFVARPRSRAREDMVAHEAKTLGLLESPGFASPAGRWQALAAEAFDRSSRPGAIVRQMHAMFATGGIAHLLPHIKAPTRIIHGDRDPLVRLIGGRRSAQLIPDAHLSVIAGLGHDLPPQLWGRFSELVADTAGLA